MRGDVPLGAPAVAGEPPAPLTWGGELPAGLRERRALLDAGDGALRALPPSLGVIAADGERARVASSAGGVATLYEARGDGVTAWSSHAAAAAWLATGTAAIDGEAAAELIATQHVGGERALVAGVRALPPATVVDLRGEAHDERSFWPFRERWAPLPAADAARNAEAVLLGTLERLLRAAPRPVLGLTAGLDSSSLAAALQELGIAFETLTFELDPDSRDVAGAAETAARLGVPHRFVELRPPTDDELESAVAREARWTEAGAPIGFGGVAWPAMSHWITGLGAETGRGFHYRWAAPRRETTSPARLVAALEAAGFGFRLVGAEAEVRRRQRARWREWVEQARAAGHDGWSALDVVYAEQRVRRWGRGQTDRLPAHPVPGFGSQELLRVLASLPLEDRLTDGFARRFLAARLPERAPPARPPARAAAAFARRRAGLARRTASAALGLGAAGSGERSGWRQAPPWRERPRLAAWLRDDVLCAPLLAEALGERWPRRVRAGFERGDPAALDLARWAAALVAFERALAQLREAPA